MEFPERASSLFTFYFLLLPSQTKFLDDLVIFVDIASLEIIQQFTSARDHFEQSRTRVVVLFVYLEMFGQFVDPLREQSNLDLRGPRVRAMRFVVRNDLFFYFFNCCHIYLS